MKSMVSHRVIKQVSVLSLLLGYASGMPALGLNLVPTTPLYVVPSAGVTDVNGNLVEGNADAPGSLVQVLSAADGIYPPDPDTGEPHPSNQPLPNGECQIGRMIAPALHQSGLFEVALYGPRPVPDQAFFVRVYDGSSIETSIFYGDSQVMLGPDQATTHLFADIGPLTNIVSLTRDTDNDGLPDWWEARYFGDLDGVDDPDALLPGHRMTAREAYIAGIDPTDAESDFLITSIAPHYADEPTEVVWPDPDTGLLSTSRYYRVVGHVLSWPSVAERVYLVEYATNILLNEFTVLVEGLEAHETGVTAYTNMFEERAVVTPKFYRARVGWPDAIPQPE